METTESDKTAIAVPAKWIPYGIFCDLVDVENIDDNGIYDFDEGIPDKINGYGGLLSGDYGNDLSKFYYVLGLVNNIEEYRDKFKVIYISSQDIQNYDTIWNYYW